MYIHLLKSKLLGSQSSTFHFHTSNITILQEIYNSVQIIINPPSFIYTKILGEYEKQQNVESTKQMVFIIWFLRCSDSNTE